MQDQWKATAPRTGSASLSSGPPAATVLGANDAVPQMQPTAALSQPAPKVEKFDASKALAIAGMVIAEKEEQKAKEDAAAKDAEPEAPPTPEPVVLMQGPAAFLSPTMEEGEEESEEESEEDGDGGEELLLLMEEEEDATAGPHGSTAAAAAAAARTARASAFATSPAPIAAAQESTAQPPPSDRAAAAAAEWDLVVEQREKTAAISTAQMLEAGMNPDRRGVKPKLGGWGNPISFVEAAERFIAAISAMPADQLPPIIPIGGGGLFSCCMSGGPPPEELEREVQLVRCGTDTIFRAPTHTDWRWPFCRSLRLQKRTTPLSKKTHLVVMPFQSWIAATTTR
eukprot:COSAG02_NODE_508_length_20916_cov_162.483691_7_plen_341_part_00